MLFVHMVSPRALFTYPAQDQFPPALRADVNVRTLTPSSSGTHTKDCAEQWQPLVSSGMAWGEVQHE